MLSGLQNIDHAILLYIQNNWHLPVLDPIMRGLSAAGELGFFWLIVSIPLLIRKKTRLAGLTTLLAIILSLVFGELILKNIIRRPRPFHEFPSVELLIKAPSSFSFPSVHAMTSFAAAGVLSAHYPKAAPWVWIMAITIAYTRLYLFVHYPSDLLGGMILGLICSFLLVKLFKTHKIRF